MSQNTPPKTAQKLFGIDKGQGLKAYQALLTHVKQVEDIGVEGKILLPWTVMMQETGLLFHEPLKLPHDAEGKELEELSGLTENRRLRDFLNEHSGMITPYNGYQDKQYAAAIGRTLSAMASAVPEEHKGTAEEALRALVESTMHKKEKRRTTRKEAPRLAPVSETAAESIEESIERAIQDDPVSLIAADIRNAATQLPEEGEQRSVRLTLLEKADTLDAMVRDKHSAKLRRHVGKEKTDETAPAPEDRKPVAAEPKQKNPLVETYVEKIFRDMKETDALFKKAGVTDAMVEARMGDTSAFEALRPEGVGMAAVIQSLYMSGTIREQMDRIMDPQWVKGRNHAAIMDFANEYENYLRFNQGEFPDGIQLFMVTNNRGFNKGVEAKLRETGNLLRSNDRFHVFESGDGLERYFKKQAEKYAPKEEKTAVEEKGAASEPTETKKQRRPATHDDMDFITGHLQEAVGRVSDIRDGHNWTGFVRKLEALASDARQRRNEKDTETTPANGNTQEQPSDTGTAADTQWTDKIHTPASQKQIRREN